MRIMKAANATILAAALLGLFPGSAPAASNDSNCANPDPAVNWYGGTYICPDEAAIPAPDADGDIRYGKELLTKTYKYLTQLGVAPGYGTGNQLSCTNCHVEEGRSFGTGSWSTVYYNTAAGINTWPPPRVRILLVSTNTLPGWAASRTACSVP